MKRYLGGLLILFTISSYAPNDPFYVEKITACRIAIETAMERENRIERLLYAIREVESGGNYEMVGGSREYGAYQFTMATWRMYTFLYFREILEMSPENQDRVARQKVENLVDAGFSDREIASIWNCGKPDWEGRIGVNRYGVRYNVPHHVEKVIAKL
jgi:hypothetical protein